MAIVLNDNLNILAPKPVDNKYGVWESGSWRPFNDTSEVLSSLVFYRYIGLTASVSTDTGTKEYWFRDGILDEDLVEKYPNQELSWDPGTGILEITLGNDVNLDGRYALLSTLISAGTGLTGGGSLAEDRTLSFDTVWGDNRYALKSHTHPISDIINLESELDGKEPVFSKGSIVSGTNISVTGNLSNRLVGSGDIVINSLAQVYPIFNRADNGLVPAPGGSTSTRYLREDGSWVVPANITYSNMTLSELNTGTATTARTISAKTLTDWIAARTYTKTESNNLFAPIVHTHEIGDIVNLQSTLDSKVNKSNSITSGYGITASPDFSGPVNIEVNTSTLDNRYLRKDANDTNSTYTLTLGNLISGGVNTSSLTLPSLSTSTEESYLVVDTNGNVSKRSINIMSSFDIGDNDGVNQFPVGHSDQLRFSGSGDTTVSFNPSTKTITITSIPGAGGGGVVTSVFGRQGGVTAQLGDYSTSLVTEGSNLYFSEGRVLGTALTGLTLSTSSVVATDSILQALGKVQGQINNSVINTRELTVSGTTGRVIVSGGAQNLTANREWIIDLVATGVTAGVYTKVTVDNYGRVTSGASLVAGDIPNLPASKITSGTFSTARIGTGSALPGTYVDGATGEWTPIPTADFTDYYTKLEVDNLLGDKQNTLISGTNIKTINGESVLGSGDILIDWNSLDDKPSLFPPSAHTHNASDINSGVLNIARIPTGTTASTVALGNHTHTFASITSKPDTILGYGITDAYTQTQIDDLLDDKYDNPTGTTSQYIRGDGSLGVLPSIAEQFNPSAGAGISITGTYPNLTISNTSPNATHTGDVTGDSTLTISNNAVTFSKMQNISTGVLLGRYSSSTGNIQTISLGTGLSLNTSTGVLSSSGTEGTVKSIGISLPNIFSVSNSPVTTTGVITASLVSQTTNTVFAGPTSGSGIPTFRSLVQNDIPNLPISKITNLQSTLNSKEVASNKVTAIGATPNNTNYPSEKAVADYVAANAPAAQTLSQPAIGQLAISGGNTVNLNTVNMSGNQTGIAGAKEWTGIHTFSSNVFLKSSGTTTQTLVFSSDAYSDWGIQKTGANKNLVFNRYIGGAIQGPALSLVNPTGAIIVHNLSGTGNGIVGVNAGGTLTRRPESDVIQTLSLGTGAGEIAISGGDTVILNSLGRAAATDFQDLFNSAPLGFSVYNNTSSTGFPTAGGTGVLLKRATDGNGSVAIGRGTGSNSDLYINIGNNSGFLGWEPLATKPWANDQGWLKSADLNGYATETWVNSQIDNIEIGGRNLLLDSKFIVGDTEANNWRSASYNTVSIVGGVARYTVSNSTGASRLERVISLEKGVYTVSVKAKTDAAPFNWRMSSLVNAQLISETNQQITDEFSILKWTFEVTNTASVTLRLYYSESLQINEYIDVEWYKLEKGNKATDWTPAPEDQVSDWNETNSNAYSFIKNKPTIPAAQVNSDWNATSGVAQILNKPTIGNGTLSLATGTGLTGSTSFTANQSTPSTFTVGVAGTHKLPTTAEWGSKQDNLVSGTTIKTINGTTLLGSGNIVTPNDNTTYTAGTGLTLSGTTFGQTITTSGTGTYVSSITQTTNGLQINLGTPANTTYTNMSAAEITAGTVTTGRVVSSKTLNDWLGGRLSTKADLVDGLIPANQLPSYVDDVLEGLYVNSTTFNDGNGDPYPHEDGKIYVDISAGSNKGSWRWTGTQYSKVEQGGITLGSTSTTAHRGDHGSEAYNLRHSHSNKAILDAITSGDISNWDAAFGWGNHAGLYVPTSRTLTAGNGLSGGGNLTANRTFTLGTPGAITLSSTNSVTTSSHTHAFTPGGTTAQYIRGDGSLATYANTTYASMSAAEITTGTATTARSISSKVLNDWLNNKNYYQSGDVNLPPVGGDFRVFPEVGGGNSPFDFDEIVGPGFYYQMSSTTSPNRPPVSGYYYLETHSYNTSNRTQIAWPYRAQVEDIWLRSRVNSPDWSSWYRIWSSRNFDPASKQDELVSGTTIKTINGTSILGSGNIVTPNTTYSLMTAAELNTGTATTARSISAERLTTWLGNKALLLSGGTVTGQIKRTTDAISADDVPRLGQLQSLVDNLGKASIFTITSDTTINWNTDFAFDDAGVVTDKTYASTFGNIIFITRLTYDTVRSVWVDESDQIEITYTGDNINQVKFSNVLADTKIIISGRGGAGLPTIFTNRGTWVSGTYNPSDWVVHRSTLSASVNSSYFLKGGAVYNSTTAPHLDLTMWTEVPAATGPQGPKGDTGDKGDTGNNGPVGPGIPTGGATGQILAKVNSTDFNTQWINLTNTDWADIWDKPTTFTPSAHTHNAVDINAGTLNVARIPNLNASKITAGTLGIARIPTGTTSSTVALGNDSRINNGQTAFGWGNHASSGYAVIGATGGQVRNNTSLDARYLQSSQVFGTTDTTVRNNHQLDARYLQPYTVPAILTANKTLSASDKNAYIRVTGTRTITMPASLSITDYPIGATTNVRVSESATVTFAGASGVTLDHPDGAGNVSVEGRKVVSIVRVDTNAYDLIY